VGGSRIWNLLEVVHFGFHVVRQKQWVSDRLRQPDNLSKRGRLTALRPYFAAGLPLSYAINLLAKEQRYPIRG